MVSWFQVKDVRNAKDVRMENLRENTKGGDIKDGKRMGRNRKKGRKKLNCSHQTERSILKIYIYVIYQL